MSPNWFYVTFSFSLSSFSTVSTSLLSIIDAYVVHMPLNIFCDIGTNCYAENGDAYGNLYSQDASNISLEMTTPTVAPWCHDHSSRVLKHPKLASQANRQHSFQPTSLLHLSGKQCAPAFCAAGFHNVPLWLVDCSSWYKSPANRPEA